jgi:predicted transcriptional regulator
MANIFDWKDRQNHKLIVPAGLADGNYVLGNVSKTIVGMMLVHFEKTSGTTISITVKGRSLEQAAGDDSVAFQPIPYVKYYVNGAVGDGTIGSAALTTTSIIAIPCHGLQVSLEIDQTDAVGTIYWTPIEGSA